MCTSLSYASIKDVQAVIHKCITLLKKSNKGKDLPFFLFILFLNINVFCVVEWCSNLFLFIANLQVVYSCFKMPSLFNMPLHYATTTNLWHCKMCLFQKHGLFMKQSFQFCPQLFLVVF